MRHELRRGAAALVILSQVAGCGAWSFLTRPEGNGGWSAAERREELAKAAVAAGVDLDGGSPPGSAPLAAIAPAGPSATDGRPEPGASAGSSSAGSAPGGPATSAGTRPGEGVAPADRLDLPGALALASSGNRRIAAAARQVEATAEHVMDVRGRLLPATSSNARYTWYSDAQTTNVDFPAGLLPPGTTIPVVKVRDAENGTVNATVSVPIDLTGELRHSLAAAQAGYRGERARLWAITLEQQLAVVRAYFDLLEALRLREVTEQTAAVYREQVGIAQERYRNGRLTKNDLLTFEVALRDAEQRLLQRALEIDRARWALNDAIGVEVDRGARLADVHSRPALPSVEESLRLTYEHNPVLVALVEEQQRLEETATALARARLPRFGAGGAVDYQSSDLLSPPQIGSGFVGFTWDMGTDLRREAQISAARIEAERNRIEIERQMRELETAVRTARRAAEERLAAYATAQVSVGQAEENLRIRQQQFDVGRAQSDDVLLASSLRAQQRATLASALYQAHTRRAELQRLMGLPIEELAGDQPGRAEPDRGGARVVE